MLKALIYRCKNGCPWRDLPKEFGHWHVVYMRFSRRAKNGVLKAGDTHLKCFILSGAKRMTPRWGGTDTAGKQESTVPVLTGRAYSGFKTRFLAWELHFKAVVPPKSNAAGKRGYDKELYKRRNETGCFFRRLKAFRAVFTRYDKLDIVFSGSVLFASIIILLRCVNTP